MKLLLVCCLALGVVGVCWAAPQRKPSGKYDNVDVDRIIGNGRILTSYIKCAMDEGPCTAEGRELKRLLPEVIKSSCDGCSEQQRKNAEKIISHMRTSRKRDWDRLLKKYDPTGEHVKKEATAKVAEASVAAPAKTTPSAAQPAPAPAKTVPVAPAPAKTNPVVIPTPAKTAPAAAESAPVPVQVAPEIAGKSS